MDPIATAQYGMMAATQRFEQSAQRVAQAGGGGDVDLVEAAVEMAMAKTAVSANAQMMRTAHEMMGVILNISA
ncbi:MAG TPA: hypothetical protein VIO94_17710 [Phenylobacterium sp.]